MAASIDQEGFTPAREPEWDLDDFGCSYPEGFDAALRQLYERSFEERNVSAEVQFAVLDAFQSSGVAAANLRHWGSEPSIHTAAMWAAGRFDLTAESLALSGAWRLHLTPGSIEQVETRLTAFKYLSKQQALVGAGSAAPGPADQRLEDAGYRVRVLDTGAFLIFEPIPWSSGSWFLGGFEGLCSRVLEAERNLRRAPYLKYDIRAHQHSLFCRTCQREAPIAGALYGLIAFEQFQRLRLFLANLVECLNLSESKLEKMCAALHNPGQDSATLRYAVIWRSFLLANYLPYVADIFAYCAKAGTDDSMVNGVNVWTALMNGEGHPVAIGFVRSLTKQEFEAALFAHEIRAATEDYPDVLAFRSRSYPMSPLVIPSVDEGLQSIPGFLKVQDTARIEDWSAFLDRTVAEDIPWWGLDAIKAIIKLAGRSAELARVESGLGGGETKLNERLETIENQVHAIHGGQLPVWELQEDTKRAVEQVLQRQSNEADLLQQISRQLNRPTIREAEASLKHALGELVFGALTAEAKAAALEGELRFLQGECADPSVVPFQLAKAFECQLRAVIMEPFRRRGQSAFQHSLRDIYDMLDRSDRDFDSFLKENGFDHRQLQQKLLNLIHERNQAAHNAVMSEQRARELRDDWLGVRRNGDSIFRAVVKTGEMRERAASPGKSKNKPS